ncbi:helix-hairpin-helix domain-containing protein [uncultured Spirosoma sp.]|uniref:helix-hairpin-helix domain-containing protein n=1 Tax=uncultured Spirosoma sp. TaxID=278208 RepID=UPI0025886EE7|nr:helix-hairpin-helix domain-containing protein [uncultured Spirosoma sp.]
MRTIWLLLAGCCLSTLALAQSDQPFRQTTDRRIDAVGRYLQDLFPAQTEGIDYEAVYDALTQLYANPLDLNNATRDELAATYLLSESQLSSLLDYRQAQGALLSIYELQAIPGFDVPTIRRMLPFVTVAGSQDLLGGLPNPTDHYLITRYERILEEQKGFSEAVADKKGNVPTRYLGDPQQWFVRYRYSRPHTFSVGLTMEKDAGERLQWQPGQYRYGFDYVSVHAQLQNRGRWRNIVLGDYQLQIGQGLVLSAGFVLGKSAETVQTVRRPTLGIRPYTSLTEYGFFRGGAATYALRPNLDLTLLASHVRRDANTIASDSTLADLTATSLQTSGLHRTLAEQADQSSLPETNLGMHLLYRNRQQLQLGLTVLHTQFGVTLKKRDQPYNEFEFTGTQNRVIGVHGGYVRHNWNLFGEVAYSAGSQTNSGGIGAVAGTLVSLNRKLDLALLFRHYDRNFHSFYANGFGEGSRTINETGAYAGLKYTVYRRLTISGFVDYFRFPWLRYLVDARSQGIDYLVQGRYTPNRQTAFYLIFHDEYKEKNLPGDKARRVVGTVRRSLAINAEYRPLPGLTMRSRVQGGMFRYAGRQASLGFALIQDASFDWRRLSVSGRVALFSTDDYDSRQYVYERDVLYAFSFPAYTNQGIRHYVLAQYSISRHLDVWARWARSDFFDQKTVGSDLDQINAPHRSEIKLQARWRF